MEQDTLVLQYTKARDNFVQRIGLVSAQLNAWTESHLHTPATLTDIAQFEGLRAERSRLLAEFEELEDLFVLELLQRLSPPGQKSG